MHTILSLLKQETASIHARLERGLDFEQRLRTLEDYRALLCGLYGLYAPLEEALGTVVEAHPLPLDFAARRKVPLLERDLRVLGLCDAAVRAVPRCARLPVVAALPEALGCLYVLEGATLGGQVIARHLARRWGMTPSLGGAFFHSYGAQVGERWRTFGAVLSAYASRAHQERIVEAACATFAAFEYWLVPDTRGMEVSYGESTTDHSAG